MQFYFQTHNAGPGPQLLSSYTHSKYGGVSPGGGRWVETEEVCACPHAPQLLETKAVPPRESPLILSSWLLFLSKDYFEYLDVYFTPSVLSTAVRSLVNNLIKLRCFTDRISCI